MSHCWLHMLRILLLAVIGLSSHIQVCLAITTSWAPLDKSCSSASIPVDLRITKKKLLGREEQGPHIMAQPLEQEVADAKPL